MFEEGVLAPEVKRRVEVAIVEAIRWSFFPVLLAGVIAVAASLLMRWENVYDKTKKKAVVEELHEEMKV